MRVVKERDERRNEILDTASRLFAAKGYAKSTVNDILDAIGIAKGTFYYYFKSKEDVLDGIIDRVTERVMSKAEAIASDMSLSPDQQLFQIFLALRVRDSVADGLLEELHKPENALMHQKSLNSMIEQVTPVLVEVVERGNGEGLFHAEFPRQYMQCFLTIITTVLDEGIAPMPVEERQEMFRAVISLLGKMLGIPYEPLWRLVQRNWR
ncbi:MAG: TetR/AcrR family transcriptional regulator [Sphaerochaetaceae bacterium]|nr:TetR/AcrR family transcriptional regulator [Sphaerochaetaceae bacterium]